MGSLIGLSLDCFVLIDSALSIFCNILALEQVKILVSSLSVVSGSFVNKFVDYQKKVIRPQVEFN